MRTLWNTFVLGGAWLLSARGLYVAFVSARTKFAPPLLELSFPSNVSKNSAYALAAFSSSSSRLASAASASFSLRVLRTLPEAYCESFASSTIFC